MSTARRQQREWLEHRYFRTYQIADFAEGVATDPFAYIGGLLQGFVSDDRLVPFVAPWQKYSALHRFGAFIADELFSGDLSGPQLVTLDSHEWPTRRILPVDRALQIYGICDDPFVPDASLSHDDAEPAALQDAYYEYFSDLRWSAVYEQLLDQLADEVFYLMFQYRAALANLHGYIATYVAEMDPSCLVEHEHEVEAACFAEPGRLKRKAPPVWARNAVFFRERGCCALCEQRIDGLTSALDIRHFDHIVPLAHGGLNDVSNLQLLCPSCNHSKGTRPVSPSPRYQSWYPR